MAASDAYQRCSDPVPRCVEVVPIVQPASPSPELIAPSKSGSLSASEEMQQVVFDAVSDPVPIEAEAPIVVAAEEDQPIPIQPLEERGDAMLCEISLLNESPFCPSILLPFE